MKIALASAKFKNGDVPFNLFQMEKYMGDAKAAGAQLVCFGESFLQGFDCLTWDYERDRAMALTISSPEIACLCSQTEKIDIDVLFGFIEREGESLYSSCALLGRGRCLQLYRRISTGWKEIRHTDDHYREGTEVEPFCYRGRSCLIALCGDLWVYPERFAGKAELLFWPVYVDFTAEQWEHDELPAYTHQAGEACPDTLLINSLTDGEAPAFGGCCHFSGGTVAAALPMGREGLLVIEI